MQHYAATMYADNASTPQINQFDMVWDVQLSNCSKAIRDPEVETSFSSSMLSNITANGQSNEVHKDTFSTSTWRNMAVGLLCFNFLRTSDNQGILQNSRAAKTCFMQPH